MPSFSRTSKSQLFKAIGNGLNSDPYDVVRTRQLFARLGRYKGDVELPYIDHELDQTIRDFQREKGLREDGLMYPEGETEAALNRALTPTKERVRPLLLKLRDRVGDMQKNLTEDVSQVQQNLSRAGFLPEAHMYSASGIIDRETDSAIRTFQKAHGLQIDGRLYPNGETERMLNRTLSFINADEEGDMPAFPEEEIEREILPPPPQKMLPGTDIPDEGVWEGDPPRRIERDEDPDPIDRIPPEHYIDPRMEMPVLPEKGGYKNASFYYSDFKRRN